MARRPNATKQGSRREDRHITRITVAGFKSIREEQSMAMRPLTILAGANSSGKSSMMQPLLLMKQTLEATYDPGPLLLNGPLVRFTEAKQLLSRERGGDPVAGFEVRTEFGPAREISIHFERTPGTGFEVSRLTVVMAGQKSSFAPGMGHDAILKELPSEVLIEFQRLVGKMKGKSAWKAVRDRCFLRPVMNVSVPNGKLAETEGSLPIMVGPPPIFWMQEVLEKLVHVPALRGNPERTYPVTAVGPTFSGTFDKYVASVIARWQAGQQRAMLDGVNEDLRALSLSWKVQAKPISDAEVEIQVGRLPRAAQGGSRDVVSIADVGFGVSQALPVIVALRVATSSHLVYLEQPEIHLHPRAQVAMAGLLADAVKRGARIVAETHSPLLLKALQTLVADGTLSPDLVILHWFMRSKTTGVTKIRSANLDDAGAFGDWPEDFGDVEMEVEKRYLDAAEARMSTK